MDSRGKATEKRRGQGRICGWYATIYEKKELSKNMHLYLYKEQEKPEKEK